MDATTAQDDAALPPTAVGNGHDANGSPESTISASLLEALDAIQPAVDGACDASSPGVDEQITNVLKSLHQSYQNGEGHTSSRYYLLSNEPSEGRLSLDKLQGRARAVAERVASICETGQEFDVFLAIL